MFRVVLRWSYSCVSVFHSNFSVYAEVQGCSGDVPLISWSCSSDVSVMFQSFCDGASELLMQMWC